MSECNCGGYYPVPTCPECMPKTTDHAEELAKALEDLLLSCLSIPDERITVPKATKCEKARSALTNYREATK